MIAVNPSSKKYQGGDNVLQGIPDFPVLSQGSTCPSAWQCDISNLAAGKLATAGSSEEGSSGQAMNAVDCRGDTRWKSDSSDDEADWLMVDLGKPIKVGRVKILWEAAYAKVSHAIITPLSMMLFLISSLSLSRLFSPSLFAFCFYQKILSHRIVNRWKHMGHQAQHDHRCWWLGRH